MRTSLGYILGENYRDDSNVFSVYASTEGQVRFLPKFINGTNLRSLSYLSNAFKKVSESSDAILAALHKNEVFHERFIQ